jgi:DNA polymerase III subunit gamma/tau
MSYLVLARKYRPETFAQVVGQEHVTRTLRNAVVSGRLGHAFLFSGIRGVGKTSVARILARTLNCEARREGEACGECPSCLDVKAGRSMDVIEIDGASHGKVENVRDLREAVLYAPSQGERTKVYIVDEVHMLSSAAFNALLKTLEEPPPRVIFILATTEAHKVPLTIQSRCQRYDFRRIPSALMTAHLGEICAREGVAISPSGLHRVAIASEGSLRDAQSLLDQVISFAGLTVADGDVDTVLGSLDRGKIVSLLSSCFGGRSGEALSTLGQMIDTGADPQQISLALVSSLRDILLLSEMPDPGALVDLPTEERAALAAIAKGADPALTRMRFALAGRAEDRMRRSSQPRFHLELALVHMARAAELGSLSSAPASLLPGARPGGRPAVPPPPPTPATAPQARAIAFDSIATPKETWEELVAFITPRAPQIGSLLLHLRCLQLGGDLLVIGGRRGEFYLEYLGEKEKLAALRKLVREFFHREMKVRLEEVDGEKAAPPSMVEKKEKQESDLARHIRRETEESEPVRAAIEVLGGRLEEIRITAGRAGAERPPAGDGAGDGAGDVELPREPEEGH